MTDRPFGQSPPAPVESEISSHRRRNSSFYRGGCQNGISQLIRSHQELPRVELSKNILILLKLYLGYLKR